MQLLAWFFIFVVVIQIIVVDCFRRYLSFLPNAHLVPNPLITDEILSKVAIDNQEDLDSLRICEAWGHKECDPTKSVHSTSHFNGTDSSGMFGESSSYTNAFGDEFHQSLLIGNGWSNELCMKDSDGDGRTNGDELGDGCCSWPQYEPVHTVDISHPGSKRSTTKRASCTLGSKATVPNNISLQSCGQNCAQLIFLVPPLIHECVCEYIVYISYNDTSDILHSFALPATGLSSEGKIFWSELQDESQTFHFKRMTPLSAESLASIYICGVPTGVVMHASLSSRNKAGQSAASDTVIRTLNDQLTKAPHCSVHLPSLSHLLPESTGFIDASGAGRMENHGSNGVMSWLSINGAGENEILYFTFFPLVLCAILTLVGMAVVRLRHANRSYLRIKGPNFRLFHLLLDKIRGIFPANMAPVPLTITMFTILTAFILAILRFNSLKYPGSMPRMTFSRATGTAAALTLVLLCLPASKYRNFNFFSLTIGSTFPSVIAVHRLLGAFAVLLASLHAITATISMLSRRMYAFTISDSEEDSDLVEVERLTVSKQFARLFSMRWSANVNTGAGVVSLLCLLLLSTLAFPCVRRKSYSTFVTPHAVLGFTATGMAAIHLWHSEMTLALLLIAPVGLVFAGILLELVDFIFGRAVVTHFSIVVASFEEPIDLGMLDSLFNEKDIESLLRIKKFLTDTSSENKVKRFRIRNKSKNEKIRAVIVKVCKYPHPLELIMPSLFFPHKQQIIESQDKTDQIQDNKFDSDTVISDVGGTSFGWFMFPSVSLLPHPLSVVPLVVQVSSKEEVNMTSNESSNSALLKGTSQFSILCRPTGSWSEGLSRKTVEILLSRTEKLISILDSENSSEAPSATLAIPAQRGVGAGVISVSASHPRVVHKSDRNILSYLEPQLSPQHEERRMEGGNPSLKANVSNNEIASSYLSLHCLLPSNLDSLYHAQNKLTRGVETSMSSNLSKVSCSRDPAVEMRLFIAGGIGITGILSEIINLQNMINSGEKSHDVLIPSIFADSFSELVWIIRADDVGIIRVLIEQIKVIMKYFSVKIYVSSTQCAPNLISSTPKGLQEILQEFERLTGATISMTRPAIQSIIEDFNKRGLTYHNSLGHKGKTIESNIILCGPLSIYNDVKTSIVSLNKLCEVQTSNLNFSLENQNNGPQSSRVYSRVTQKTFYW